MLARRRFDHPIGADIPHEQSQPFSQRRRDRFARPNLLGHLHLLRGEIRLRENLERIAALLLVRQRFDSPLKVHKALDA